MSRPGEAAAPTLFLTDADVRAVADWPGVIERLRSAYSEQQRPGSTPDRAVAVTASGWMRVLPSAPSGQRFTGSKTIVASFRRNVASYLICLFDHDSAELVALIDGDRITGLRTAATAAVAVSAVMRADPVDAAVIGSGFEARGIVRAVAHVTDLRSVRVFSPTPAHRTAFASEMASELDVPVVAADSAREAVDGAGLILCAARSRDEEPTLKSEWVRDGTTIVSVGSTTASQRELDTALIGRARLIVADMPSEVLHDTGDMIAARDVGTHVDEVTVSLSDFLAKGDDAPNDGITIYKSTGSGFQDIVLAAHLYERAVQRGLGTALPATITPVVK